MRRAVIDLGQPGMPAGAFLFAASSHSQKVEFQVRISARNTRWKTPSARRSLTKTLQLERRRPYPRDFLVLEFRLSVGSIPIKHGHEAIFYRDLLHENGADDVVCDTPLA
ncbi:hypothetical protein ACF1BQ_031460 [Bradyrhizobium sp. RDT10]